MADLDDDDVPTLVADAANVAVTAASASKGWQGDDAPAFAPPALSNSKPLATPPPDKSVPLCILTGWLGAGKTTLLRRIMQHCASRSLKVAIIQNEVSALGVEEEIVPQDKTEYDTTAFNELLELANGCVCCSVKNDFVSGLEALLSRTTFDYVIVECSGVVDPGPVMELFWLDQELPSAIYLDSVITVVDAYNLQRGIRQSDAEQQQSAATAEEAQCVTRQIAYADIILLNKVDLVTDNEQLQAVQQQIRQYNHTAPVYETRNSDVQIDRILNQRLFDTAAAVSKQLDNLHSTKRHAHEHASHQHCHKCDSDSQSHEHDATISNYVIDISEAEDYIDLQRLNLWLADLLWQETDPAAAQAEQHSKSKQHIFRLKAILNVQGQSHPHYLQGVQSLFQLEVGSQPWSTSRYSRLVVIGRHLQRSQLQAGFRSCIQHR